MWKYNDTDELYHYGVAGMKWGIRRHLYNWYSSQNKLDSSRLTNLKKNYAWQQKNDASIKRSKSKIGNSKILTKIRAARMKNTKNRIKISEDSIKENKQIVNNLKKKLAQHSKAELAKTKMKIAKNDFRAFNRQASRDWSNGHKVLSTKAHKDLAKSSLAKNRKLYDNYIKKKTEYKKLKATL